MKRQSWLKLMAGVLLLGSAGLVHAERDEGRHGGVDVVPVNNQPYADECGACHFAYQPGLLPARSWRKVMQGLHDHFGENAELSASKRDELLDYLVKHAADNADARLSRKVIRYLKADEAPLRISKVGYLAREHREIPQKVFTGDLQGLANCNACHTRAAEGSYGESEIKIPGHGRWDD